MMFISVLQLPQLSFLLFHVSFIPVKISYIYSEQRVRSFKAVCNRITKSVIDGTVVVWAFSILLGNTVASPYC